MELVKHSSRELFKIVYFIKWKFEGLMINVFFLKGLFQVEK